MGITPTPPQPQRRRGHGNGEAVLQSKCWAWLWNERPETRGLYFAVPNENSRSVYENKRQQLVSGAMRKVMGVTAGVADTLLLLPRGKYHGACVEFKTPTGRQSEAQVAWQGKVEAAGYYYAVVRTLDDFQRVMDWYLNLK